MTINDSQRLADQTNLNASGQGQGQGRQGTKRRRRSTRVRTGCLTCRDKKRKCDEIKKIDPKTKKLKCKFCSKYSLDCNWPATTFGPIFINSSINDADEINRKKLKQIDLKPVIGDLNLIQFKDSIQYHDEKIAESEKNKKTIKSKENITNNDSTIDNDNNIDQNLKPNNNVNNTNNNNMSLPQTVMKQKAIEGMMSLSNQRRQNLQQRSQQLTSNYPTTTTNDECVNEVSDSSNTRINTFSKQREFISIDTELKTKSFPSTTSLKNYNFDLIQNIMPNQEPQQHHHNHHQQQQQYQQSNQQPNQQPNQQHQQQQNEFQQQQQHNNSNNNYSTQYNYQQNNNNNQYHNMNNSNSNSGSNEGSDSSLPLTLDSVRKEILDYNSIVDFLEDVPPIYYDLPDTLRDFMYLNAATNLEGSPVSLPSDVPPPDVFVEYFKSNDLNHVEPPHISKDERVILMKNYIDEVSTWLDMFNKDRHFGTIIPILAENCPALMYSILALSAKQYENTHSNYPKERALCLYQHALQQLVNTSSYNSKITSSVLAACVILCVFTMLSSSPKDWRKHLEGCCVLFKSYNVNGFSTPLDRSIFWCYIRMDVCSAVIGEQDTIVDCQSWIPLGYSIYDSRSLFIEQCDESNWDMYANYMVFLCSRVLNLVSSEDSGKRFENEWKLLWTELSNWESDKPAGMKPIVEVDDPSLTFPTILYSNGAAISANQMYHMAIILMLQNKPRLFKWSKNTTDKNWNNSQTVRQGSANTSSSMNGGNNSFFYDSASSTASNYLDQEEETDAITKRNIANNINNRNTSDTNNKFMNNVECKTEEYQQLNENFFNKRESLKKSENNNEHIEMSSNYDKEDPVGSIKLKRQQKQQPSLPPTSSPSVSLSPTSPFLTGENRSKYTRRNSSQQQQQQQQQNQTHNQFQMSTYKSQFPTRYDATSANDYRGSISGHLSLDGDTDSKGQSSKPPASSMKQGSINNPGGGKSKEQFFIYSKSPTWHARRICGIGMSNSDHGAYTNSLQPFWVAGKLTSSITEHHLILKHLNDIEKKIGWSTKSRSKDLIEYWSGDV
ncbi:hypothetical protein B5S28_g4119 [[Candida] boidinii]|uniref:Unnamed protein product n=1 Tax=Candida boidinii TaxID=5477 RepID=A0ACB5TF60_CANBO|nr:hypothetical protein B5S28_g4119 [[Candida] boidinii]GME87638.1 unnamed protein product [[Candida] boidinii]